MELALELLLEILLTVLQFFGEIVLQILFEAGVEFIGHALRSRVPAKPVHPALAALGCAALGALAGRISLFILPSLLLARPWMRAVNLVAAPLIAGFVMSAIGNMRQRREQERSPLDRFWYAFLFALSMALVRFFWGR